MGKVIHTYVCITLPVGWTKKPHLAKGFQNMKIGEVLRPFLRRCFQIQAHLEFLLFNFYGILYHQCKLNHYLTHIITFFSFGTNQVLHWHVFCFFRSTHPELCIVIALHSLSIKSSVNQQKLPFSDPNPPPLC